MSQHYGVDVSSNNAHPINWVALRSYLQGQGQGARPFAIIKATEGSYYINPYLKADLEAARAAGFDVGTYLMTSGTSSVNGMLLTYDKAGGISPPFYDVELPAGLIEASYIEQTKQILAARPGYVYLNQSEVAAGYPQGLGLWLAQYNNNPGVTSVPCMIHQYTSTATIPGASGSFDLNVFTGSETQYQTAFHVSPPLPEEVKVPGVSVSVTTSDGIRHRTYVYRGALCQSWTASGVNVWGTENVAKAADRTGHWVSTVTWADQVPTIQVEGNELVIGATAANGTPWEFRQTTGTATWSAVQILN